MPDFKQGLETASSTASAIWLGVDTFVEDHPRWSIGIFAFVEVVTIWAMWG